MGLRQSDRSVNGTGSGELTKLDIWSNFEFLAQRGLYRTQQYSRFEVWHERFTVACQLSPDRRRGDPKFKIWDA